MNFQDPAQCMPAKWMVSSNPAPPHSQLAGVWPRANPNRHFLDWTNQFQNTRAQDTRRANPYNPFLNVPIRSAFSTDGKYIVDFPPWYQQSDVSTNPNVSAANPTRQAPMAAAQRGALLPNRRAHNANSTSQKSFK